MVQYSNGGSELRGDGMSVPYPWVWVATLPPGPPPPPSSGWRGDLLQEFNCLDAGPRGPVSRAAADRTAAWCDYLAAHARRLYATVTDPAAWRPRSCRLP